LEAIAADPAAAPVNAAADRKSFGGHGHGDGAGGGVLAGAQDLSGKVAGMFTVDHDAAAVDDDMGDADRIGLEPHLAGGEIVPHFQRADAHGGRVEHHEIGEPPFAHDAAFAQADEFGRYLG